MKKKNELPGREYSLAAVAALLLLTQYLIYY
jgi:hypothetical protein